MALLDTGQLQQENRDELNRKQQDELEVKIIKMDKEKKMPHEGD